MISKIELPMEKGTVPYSFSIEYAYEKLCEKTPKLSYPTLPCPDFILPKEFKKNDEYTNWHQWYDNFEKTHKSKTSKCVVLGRKHGFWNKCFNDHVDVGGKVLPCPVLAWSDRDWGSRTIDRIGIVTYSLAPIATSPHWYVIGYETSEMEDYYLANTNEQGIIQHIYPIRDVPEFTTLIPKVIDVDKYIRYCRIVCGIEGIPQDRSYIYWTRFIERMVRKHKQTNHAQQYNDKLKR